MIPFKPHIIFGLLLILAGIIFDFTFVQTKISDSFKTDPVAYINSFEHQLYILTAFYMFVLGFLNIALALLIRYFAPAANFNWVIFGLIFVGSILVIATGLWYASAGHSLKWETRCTVLTIGLISIVSGLGMEIYRFFISKKLN